MHPLLPHLATLESYLPNIKPRKGIFGNDKTIKKAQQAAISCLAEMMNNPLIYPETLERYKEQSGWLSDQITPRDHIVATLQAVHSNASKLVRISHSHTIESDLST